jgi:hypothetical protein
MNACLWPIGEFSCQHCNGWHEAPHFTSSETM